MYKRYKAGILLLICLTTSACDLRRPVEDPVNDEMLRERISERIEGYKLKDLAGQTHLPRYESVQDQQNIISDALVYAGRYKVEIGCEDAFVECEEGTVDLVLNLLSNGTAHRTIVYIGSMTSDTLKQYRQDHWAYDMSHHQIIVERETGVTVFYDISESGDLVLNRDKTATATEINREYFTENALPAESYIFNKIE